MLHGEVNITDIAGERDASLRLARLNVLGENITNTMELSPSLCPDILPRPGDVARIFWR